MEFFIKRNDDVKEIISFSSGVFDVEYNESLLHQMVLFYSYNSHLKTKSQKTRSEVSGGGCKPWRQKGTGRARAGSIRSPLWRGGGKIFAARGLIEKRKKINKKMYRLGMRVIFSELIRQNRVSIIEDLSVSGLKTKDFLGEIQFLSISNSALFVVDNLSKNLYFSTRNLKNIFVITCCSMNPMILMKFKSIFVTKTSLKLIEELIR
ncbi:MAG TPA: 50S ribosomal protein L4 [Candidatus Azoamicus sp. OHIO1]